MKLSAVKNNGRIEKVGINGSVFNQVDATTKFEEGSINAGTVVINQHHHHHYLARQASSPSGVHTLGLSKTTSLSAGVNKETNADKVKEKEGEKNHNRKGSIPLPPWNMSREAAPSPALEEKIDEDMT